MTASVEIQNRLGNWEPHCTGTIEWCLNAFDSVLLNDHQLAVRVVYGTESMVSKKIDSPLAIAFFERLSRVSSPELPLEVGRVCHCPHCGGVMQMDDVGVLNCTVCGAYCEFETFGSYGAANANEAGAVACDNLPACEGK